MGANEWNRLADISRLNGLAILALDSAYAIEQAINGNIMSDELNKARLLLKAINERDGIFDKIRMNMCLIMNINDDGLHSVLGNGISIDRNSLLLFLKIHDAINNTEDKLRADAI